MLSKKWIYLTALLFVFVFTQILFADWKDNAEVIKISGGEKHTLVLTEDNYVWACGPNGEIGIYYGVLGIGSSSPTLVKKTLTHVHDGDMNTPSDFLENITGISGGWKHSLAVDSNSGVWSWGWNYQGQLGDGTYTTRTEPVQVHGPNNVGLLQHIVAVAAGKSGKDFLKNFLCYHSINSNITIG